MKGKNREMKGKNREMKGKRMEDPMQNFAQGEEEGNGTEHERKETTY